MMNMHKGRGDKFGARSISYPELGGHVLTPEFGRAHRQGLQVTGQGVSKKEKRFLPRGRWRAASHGKCADGARKNRSLPLEGLKSVENN